jgi:hypothetical protein
MQALRLPPAAADEDPPLVGDELPSPALELEAGFEHPAKSSDAAPAAATILKA